MNNRLMTRAAIVASALLAGPMAYGQSADALIDKLVDKGVLTVREANELREESDLAFTRAHAAKTGLPDYVTQMKLYGDVRGRYEGIFVDGDAPDRNRFRYRARLGVSVTFFQNIEAGIRLSSGENGDPISGNTTFSDNASKKGVYMDLAYGKWTPINHNGWTLSTTIGKMENPFTTSDMEFDRDYTPEGAALNASYQLNDHHVLKLNAAGFALEEDRAFTRDPSMIGAQLRWDGKYAQKEGYYTWESSLGVAGYALGSADNLVNGAVPNSNVGNTRDDAGRLVYNYNPIVADASLTYNIAHVPYYVGTFPIKVEADLMHNPAAPSGNTGWWAGVTFGKAGKKRTWELGYRYKRLEADAWYEEFTDSDFGAYYATAPANSAGGDNRYLSGTGVQGHIVRAVYAPYDSMNFGLTYFLTEAIGQPNSGASRIQVDVNWKF